MTEKNLMLKHARFNFQNVQCTTLVYKCYTNSKLENMKTNVLPEVLRNQLSTKQAQQNELTQRDPIAQE